MTPLQNIIFDHCAYVFPFCAVVLRFLLRCWHGDMPIIWTPTTVTREVLFAIVLFFATTIIAMDVLVNWQEMIFENHGTPLDSSRYRRYFARSFKARTRMMSRAETWTSSGPAG